MRKKLKMRAGGKVTKYAEGGRVSGQRPQEDRARMAAEAAAGFDEEEARVLGRRRAANPWLRGESIINNRPVGAAAPVAGPVRQSGPRMSDAAGQPAIDLIGPPPVPPPVPASTRARARPISRRRSSADDLNEREMTRLLNERSLEAARGGRSMFRKGGAVMGGTKKDDDSDDIVDNSPRRGPIPRAQGLRGAIANTTRRERMDADYPAQPIKPFRRGGRVAAKKK
jgi:hypothetical protein